MMYDISFISPPELLDLIFTFLTRIATFLFLVTGIVYFLSNTK